MTDRRRSAIFFASCSAALAAFFCVCSPVANAEPPWARALDDFSVFPIAVWLQRPEHARRYRELGINLYVGLWKGPTPAQLAELRRAGMPVIAEQNEVGLKDENRDVIVGWLHQDEPDNAQRIASWPLPGKGPAWGDPIAPEVIRARYETMKAKDPTRPVLLGLGQGVAWEGWKGRGSRIGRLEDYPGYMKGADIVAFDIYPAAHSSPEVFGRLEFVARGVARLKSWARTGQRVWNTIGASPVKVASAVVDPDQVRSQVWMSIINGSRGIVYFVHQFEPRFVEAYWFEKPELARAVADINRRVQSLAAVINGPETREVAEVRVQSEGLDLEAARSLAITARKAGCSTYVFATSLVGQPTRVAMRTLASGRAARAEVLDEARSVAVGGDGWLEDSFGPYATHLYEVKGALANSDQCR